MIEELLPRIIVSLVIGLAGLVVKSLSLQIVESVVNGWTWCYTLFVPEDVGKDRRGEVRSGFYEGKVALIAEGHNRASAAVILVLQMVSGIRHDLVWLSPYLASKAVLKLERWIEILSELGTPRDAITALSMSIFFLLGALTQYPDIHWTSIVYALACPPAAVIVLKYLRQFHEAGIVRRVAHIITILGIAFNLIALGGMAWLVGEHRFYENPLFYRLPVALFPLLLSAILATPECRRRLFSGRWWPVFVCWGILILVSVGSVLKFAEDPSPWFEIWSMSATIVITFSILVGICIGIARVIWSYGIRASVVAMRVAADGMRHLL